MLPDKFIIAFPCPKIKFIHYVTFAFDLVNKILMIDVGNSSWGNGGNDPFWTSIRFEAGRREERAQFGLNFLAKAHLLPKGYHWTEQCHWTNHIIANGKTKRDYSYYDDLGNVDFQWSKATPIRFQPFKIEKRTLTWVSSFVDEAESKREDIFDWLEDLIIKNADNRFHMYPVHQACLVHLHEQFTDDFIPKLSALWDSLALSQLVFVHDEEALRIMRRRSGAKDAAEFLFLALMQAGQYDDVLGVCVKEAIAFIRSSVKKKPDKLTKKEVTKAVQRHLRRRKLPDTKFFEIMASLGELNKLAKGK